MSTGSPTRQAVCGSPSGSSSATAAISTRCLPSRYSARLARSGGFWAEPEHQWTHVLASVLLVSPSRDGCSIAGGHMGSATAATVFSQVGEQVVHRAVLGRIDQLPA